MVLSFNPLCRIGKDNNFVNMTLEKVPQYNEETKIDLMLVNHLKMLLLQQHITCAVVYTVVAMRLWQMCSDADLCSYGATLCLSLPGESVNDETDKT